VFTDVESIHRAADEENGARLLGHLYVRYFADLFGKFVFHPVFPFVIPVLLFWKQRLHSASVT
jgi:hypothetical protein